LLIDSANDNRARAEAAPKNHIPIWDSTRVSERLFLFTVCGLFYAFTVSHTYVCSLVHCVFSTKNRRNLIPPEVQPDLWSFLGGIARKNGFKALIAGGTENHMHILLSLPATMALAKAMQLIKGASSHWMNEKHARNFAWQEGYGAFTVGISQKAETIGYIRSQPEHHRKRSFEEEFVAFLKKHNVDYDPRYVWG
jgi:putative transposase